MASTAKLALVEAFNAAAETTVSIEAGKLTRESIASPILSRDIVPPDEP